MDFLTANWMPLIWLIIAVGLFVVEALTADLVAVWFALGALASIIPAFIGTPFWIQLLTCLVIGIICIMFTRPVLKDILKVKKISTNADAVIGMIGVVIETIDNVAETGRVHVNGLDWTARSDDGSPIAGGERVLVRKIEGVKAIVELII